MPAANKPATARIEAEQSRWRLSGALTFGSVTGLLHESERLWAQQAPDVLDCQDVSHSDSAGLALLVEWQRRAEAEQRRLRYHALPAQLQTLINISGLSDLLNADNA